MNRLENFSRENSQSALPAQVKMAKTLIKILIVDDRAAVRESLRTILSLEDDFEIVGEAPNGREAVEAARQTQPDLVLTDLEMPDPHGELFDGVVVCERVKSQGLARYVVILTVHADQAVRQRAAQVGCDLFLEKGINSFELLDQLRNLAQS